MNIINLFTRAASLFIFYKRYDINFEKEIFPPFCLHNCGKQFNVSYVEAHKKAAHRERERKASGEMSEFKSLVQS